MPQDICFNDLKFIIEFVYRGEIDVSQAELQVCCSLCKCTAVFLNTDKFLSTLVICGSIFLVCFICCVRIHSVMCVCQNVCFIIQPFDSVCKN